jgi:hypothetical protein
MAIVDDYAGIAAELRRIQAERRPKPEVIPPRAQLAYITRRGPMRISIDPDHPLAQRAITKD